MDAHSRAHRAAKHNLYRRAMPAEGVTYCFLFADDPDPELREGRKAMLAAFCLVARGKFQENKRVLGIATEMKIRPQCSYDFYLLEIPDWTDAHQREMERLKRDFGILANPAVERMSGDEYPTADEGK